MTNLERLIKAHTEATTATTISSATEKLADEMAREAVKDPVFRKELQRLVRTYFSGTMQALAKPGRKSDEPPARHARGRRTPRSVSGTRESDAVAAATSPRKIGVTVAESVNADFNVATSAAG